VTTREIAPSAPLTGAKTVLRRVRREDVQLFVQWLNDPEVMRHWAGLSETLSAQDAKEMVDEFMDSGPGVACLIIEAEGAPVGFIELAGEPDDANYSHKVELDICIGIPARWHQGLGSDALMTLLRWYFTQTGIVRVFLQPRVNNPRAIHVYEKVGFRKEGVLRWGEMTDGVLHDTVMMAAIRDEWLAGFGNR
jgi:RimJ/RimL family protein N-acetyltransferase